MALVKKEKKTINGFRLLFGYLGLFIAVEGVLTLFPLAILAFYPEEYNCWMDFVIPGAAGIVIGLLMFLVLIAGRKKGKFGKRDDSLLLVLLWISAVLLGAMPFFVDSLIGQMTGDTARLSMDFSESFFESMSGYSATGLTVFTGFLDSSYPYAHVFLFHRAMMQFIGGVGLVLVVTSIVSDKYNLKLFVAEGHNDHLLPNMGKTARWIFLIYIVYILLGTGALALVGMNPFEALCHSISCLATGGFSTRSSGLLYWQSGEGALPLANQIGMEVVFEVLMILGATSFVVHFLLFTIFAKPLKKGVVRKRFVGIFKDFEIRFSLITTVVVTAICAVYTFVYALETPSVLSEYLTTNGSLSIWESIRYNLFNTISCLSTTGYSNCGPLAPTTGTLSCMGEVTVLCSVFLMIVGGAVGSTAGGIKQYRFGVAMKEFYWSIRNRFSTNITISSKPITHHGSLTQVSDADRSDAYNYSFLYLGVLFVGSLALLALPYTTFGSSVYNFASALSGTGLGLFDFSVEGKMVYSFLGYKEALTAAGKSTFGYYAMLWIIDVGMLLGRLEIMACYFALKSFFYDPLKNAAELGQFKGLIFVLKEQKSIAIRKGDMNKAEAITEVISNYESRQKSNIEANGENAKMTQRDLVDLMVKMRDSYIVESKNQDSEALRIKYEEMAEDINLYLPFGKRKKF